MLLANCRETVIEAGHLLGHERGALGRGQEPAACQKMTTTAVAGCGHSSAARWDDGGRRGAAGGPIAGDQQA
jgi:hypothetical protein